jgi:phosphopantetheinyl transferase
MYYHLYEFQDISAPFCRYLCNVEQAQFKQLPQRKSLGWLASRYALKRVVQDYYRQEHSFDVNLSEIFITSQRGQPPQCRILTHRQQECFHETKKFSLSLSHSGSFGMGALSIKKRDGLVGVDIEVIQVWPQNIVHAFLTKAERNTVNQKSVLNRDASVTLLWCLKEAYLKAIGVGLAIHPKCIEITLDSQFLPLSLTHGGKVMDVQMEVIEEGEKYRGALVTVRNCNQGGFWKQENGK